MKLSSESGSLSWSTTLTNSGPYAPSTTGPANFAGFALEKPPFWPAVHCIGVRTASRPPAARFSPMPISSP